MESARAEQQDTKDPRSRATPGDYALGQDVARPYGEYQYIPQRGVYNEVAIADVTEDFQAGLRAAGGVAYQINRYTGWSSSSSLGGFSLDLRAGIGGFGLPSLGVGWGSDYAGIDSGGLAIVAGPVVLDRFYAGMGAIYTDLNGYYPGREQLAPDDRWTYIMWLSFRSTLFLGESITISLQPFFYWLPTTGEVGWGLPAPMAGMMLPQLGTVGLFNLTWTKEVANWKYILYDQFSPLLGGLNIWDVNANFNSTWGDLSPIDRVGRYAVGYGAGEMTQYDPRVSLGLRDDMWQGSEIYYNILGGRAYGRHGYRTNSMFYIDRFDSWDKSFKHGFAGISGGAYIKSGDQFLSTYAGYNFISSEPFDQFINWAVVGVRKQLSPTMMSYAQAGYYWIAGPGKGDEGWTAMLGLQQRLALRTSHGAEVGRRVYRPINSAPGIEDYAEYRFIHQFGIRSNFLAFYGISQRHLTSNIENDYSFKYGGGMLTTHVTDRIDAFMTSSWEEVDDEASNQIINRWIHRLGLMYALSETTSSNCFYQYEDVHGSTRNYSEHFIYLGVTKRF